MSDEPIFHKTPMVAMTFAVQCPLCEMATEIDAVEQDDAGVWHATDEARFLKCHACGADIEAQGVTMEGTAEPFFRNTGSSR